MNSFKTPWKLCFFVVACVFVINNMKRNETKWNKCSAECEWNFAYGWLAGWNCVCNVRLGTLQCVCDLTTNTCTLLFQFFSVLSRHFSQSLTNKAATTHALTTKKTIIVDNIHSTRNRSKCQKRVFALLHMVHVLKLARLRLIVSCVAFFLLSTCSVSICCNSFFRSWNVFCPSCLFCGCLLYSLSLLFFV